MPLDSTRHAHVINLMLRNGQPARILFKTNQRVAGAGQPRSRMGICGGGGTVAETELGKYAECSEGIWVREYDLHRQDHISGLHKFMQFEQITGVQMMQPSEFCECTAEGICGGIGASRDDSICGGIGATCDGSRGNASRAG